MRDRDSCFAKGRHGTCGRTQALSLWTKPPPRTEGGPFLTDHAVVGTIARAVVVGKIAVVESLSEYPIVLAIIGAAEREGDLG
jgi:hypothetical protein